MLRHQIFISKVLLVLVMLSPISMATNGVNLFTTKTVGVPGDNFAFFCSNPSRNALSVQWLVNGTLLELENSRLENVFLEFNSRSKTADLSFDLPLERNITTIQCIGSFASGNVSSETITVLLQGLLSAVGSSFVALTNTAIFLTWTAPFTLEISDVEPDITYCVDVVNSTSSSSECEITVTSFSIPIGRVCDNYNFTVIPVNGAGNGTAVTLGYSQNFTAPTASEELLLPISVSTYQITMSAPVCDGELTVINVNTGDETHIQGSDLSITTNHITFINENIPKNQLYTVSINASNINGSAVSYVSLSTHDVMKTTFDVTSHTITTEYFEYSTAMGALYIFIFINEDRSLDFKISIYLPLDRNSSLNYTLPDLSPGQYQMFVYDIDRDVTLHPGVSYPANTDMFSIISNDLQTSYSQSTSSELQDCSVTYVDDIISAMCSYSGDSSVTGFQIIVQLNNVDEVHKLYINGTTEHLSPGPVIVRVEESGSYHVTIFPVMGDRGIVDTTIAYSEVLSVTKPQTMMPETSKESSLGWIIAVGVVVPLLLIIIIGYIYYKNHSLKKNKDKNFEEPNITVVSFSGISSNDSTPLSISLSAASAQSTESEDNPGGKESKPGHDIGNQVMGDNSPPQEVDNNVQRINCNTGWSMEENNKEVNSQQILKPITEGTMGSNTEDAVGTNTEDAVGSNTVGTNTEDAVGSNTEGHDIGNQVMGDNSPPQEVDNNVQRIDCNTEWSMEENNKEVNSQQILKPITEGTMGSNTEDAVGTNTEDAVGSNTEGTVGTDAVGSNTEGTVGTNTEGHDIGNQVMGDNSPPQEVDNNVQSNTGWSMEEKNEEVNSQQTLKPITEGTIGSNTESNYAELSHSHLPGHTDLDQEHGEIGRSINNDLTDTFVQPKRDKSTNIAFEISRSVNRNTYATAIPHLAHHKESISLLTKDDLPSILDHLKSVTRWRSLGMVFTQDQKAPHIQQNFPVDSLESVILYWLESGPKENRTWKYLVTALKKIGEDSVANHILRQHSSSTNESSADPVKLAATEPQQENLGRNDELRHLYDVIFTVQDCVSTVAFMSQCGLSQDPSSSMTATKTCLTGHMVTESIKSSHVALKPATNIFNDSNVKLVYLETKSSSDSSCSINDYLMGVNVYGETVGEDRHEEKMMKQNSQAFWMKNILVK